MASFKGWNGRSYKTGSPFPPTTPGLLRIYNMRFCPFAHRTVLALAAKGVPVEFVNCNLKAKPEWLAEKNPAGAKVPVLELDGKIVYESNICNEWLDDVYPEHGSRILPSDPTERAKAKILAERLSSHINAALFGWYRARDEAAKAKLAEGLAAAEALLEGDFFAGSEPGFADFSVWPWLERLEGVQLMSGGEVGIRKEATPRLAAYVERMMERAEVKAAYRDAATHVAFLKSFVSGEPDYDVGITAA